METIQQKFESMCKLILIGPNGFFFPFDNIIYDGEFDYLTEDTDYPLLKEKMDNLIVLVNKDHSIVEKDITEEIWDLI